uniref:phosphatidylinositol-3,4-bisphosphate 4-phosphatase n=1 Tax=Cacopsylla melanoneura TaxID=428564 RepID=A0A8D8TYP2_9HEMI
MRFNKQEMLTLATQPSQKFDKEGVLFLRERQDGLFRKTELCLERWCRLRGNLLFYFKSKDQWSEPVGVIVLTHCSIKMDQSALDGGPYGFFLVFEGGLSQHLAAYSEPERDAWLELIQRASYSSVRSQFLALQQQMELRRGHDPTLDVHMWRLRRGRHVDPSEIPLCEIAVSCDNLLCDGNGRPPNPLLVLHVFIPGDGVWLKYANTELIERSSNPTFLQTVCLRSSDGLNEDTRLRITAYDVREAFSQISTIIGSVTIRLAKVMRSPEPRLRIALHSAFGVTIGFLSLCVFKHEPEPGNNPPSSESTPCRSLPQHHLSVKPNHRRTQSLPPRLGSRLRLPNQGHLKYLFANATVTTYRFHSGLGGDISMHEVMAESRLCFTFPQQLLAIWIQEEKELLQEVAGMGELVEPWHSKQVELLDRHLQLLHLYSQAKENLAAHKGNYFKQSCKRNDRSLEFAPINLHLQRMWAHSESLKKCDFYDVITVGAFTAHSHKSKNGGLIKLLQQLKESPLDNASGCSANNQKIAMAHDAIQAIKQLRREVVDAMRSLMTLAKAKQTTGMLPICDDMMNKTGILLSLWDPGLVEEALAFIDEHKVSHLTNSGSPDDTALVMMSPFRRITQQLNLDLKSPDLDLMELQTPDSPQRQCISNLLNLAKTNGTNKSNDNSQFIIFPDAEVEEDTSGQNIKPKTDENSNLEPHSNSTPVQTNSNRTNNNETRNQNESNVRTELTNVNGNTRRDSANGIRDRNGIGGDVGRKFLDTQEMCSSPSANYYRPCEEPEPWDLTQLNIEASVMCLVSKVKFLCGRCGSPAPRVKSKAPQRSSTFREESASKISNPLDTGTPQPESLPASINSSCPPPPRKGNKFTDGLDLSCISDWPAELRPAMKKLRLAMDGLLKTARLTHSVFRLTEDRKAAQRACNVRYRRHVCFSQALTALVTALMTRLLCRKPDPIFLHILTTIGPLVCFEGLLSYYGEEVDAWGDMIVAIEDLATVNFTITRIKKGSDFTPKVVGSRNALGVLLPVPDVILSLLPVSQSFTHVFRVTPVFFNIGINEKATLAETLGTTKPQIQSNVDNFDRLNEYYHRFRRLSVPVSHRLPSLPRLMDNMKLATHTTKSKNVEILQTAAKIARMMRGLRLTSCKSAKDRTGMSCTLEQVDILSTEYDLAEHEYQKALDCMRSEGCRRENTAKNIGVRKYAFNTLQLMTFPNLYKPPPGTYGSAQT